MAFIVECVRRAADGGPACLDVSDRTWPKLVALGRAHGWRPRGALPDPLPYDDEARWDPRVDLTYNPGEWRYARRVETADAHAWSDALYRALARGARMPADGAAVLSESASDATNREINAPLRAIVEKAAAFFAGGAFAFAYDD
jgi:hypothetical protein